MTISYNNPHDENQPLGSLYTSGVGNDLSCLVTIVCQPNELTMLLKFRYLTKGIITWQPLCIKTLDGYTTYRGYLK